MYPRILAKSVIFVDFCGSIGVRTRPPFWCCAFLILEGRRLTFYHLWQQRVLLLERALVRPAVSDDESAVAALGEELEPALGTTVPTMPLVFFNSTDASTQILNNATGAHFDETIRRVFHPP